jgi:hypothetical protein
VFSRHLVVARVTETGVLAGPRVAPPLGDQLSVH